ncbi:hypothetical protein GCM10027592_03530 [Spirosoma flavus]
MPLSPSSLNGYDFASQAEKEIYHVAAESRYFNNSERYFFHSLDMAKTSGKKLKGEIDFVYLDVDCILFLEVKGGQVKYSSLENQWYVLGGTQPGNPFRQAYEALFYTRDTLLPNLFEGKAVPGRLAYGIGVLLPETLKPKEFSHSAAGQMEFDPELIYDYHDHKNNKFVAYIEKLKRYWTAHPQYINRVGLSQREVTTVSRYFRQDLHFQLPVSDLLSKGDEETQRLTGMQLFVLDNLAYNPGKGGIIIGGPGTGKTILALELLKRSITNNRRTLLVCYNKNLALFLQKQSRLLSVVGDYTICHLHALYSEVQQTQLMPASGDETNEYWSRDLPLLFIRNLQDIGRHKYDYLIIDEGQDILNEYHFEALGQLLKGGLESGNWSVFMDKEYQNIYNRDAEEYFHYLREVYPCFVSLLQLNCRNTISTIQGASIQTGFPAMSCLRRDDIWKSEIRPYHSETDLINKLIMTAKKLDNYGVDKKDITILCFTKSQINSLVRSNRNLFTENAFSVPEKINVTTIHAYKGLENKFILICGPEDYDTGNKQQMSLIYIANSRATAQSIFFINIRYASIISDRITSSNFH